MTHSVLQRWVGRIKRSLQAIRDRRPCRSREGRRRGDSARLAMMIASLAIGALTVTAGSLTAAVVALQNGVILEGDLGYIPSIAENPMVTNVPAGAVEVNQIVLVNDGLRRTYVSNLQVDSLGESDPAGSERIRIRQNVANGNRQIGAVTAIRGVSPFNQYGRRIYSILTARGPLDIPQGITEITPTYLRVQGLHGRPAIRWDCREATSSLPRETLSQIVRRQATLSGPDARMAIVRLLFQAERYRDAQLELEQAMIEFPELEELNALLVELRQYTATRLVDEIERRQAAGQHQRVRMLLSQFPEQGVAQETLFRVSELAREYQQADASRQQVLDDLANLIAGIKDPAVRGEVEAVQSEIDGALSESTISRLADYERLRSDEKIDAESRLALLVSGWVVGAGSASQNLIEALSLVRVRKLVHRYLQANTEAERTEILRQMDREEGGTPQRLVEIVRQLRPPISTSQDPNLPNGYFRINVAGVRGETIQYEVQLPPEYDPYRKYPAVLTLHGRNQTPSAQIDWWAGSYRADVKQRAGQAGRHGYIVIAPQWSRAGQRNYEYSGREHAAVLTCLRDAQRRFSVDSDRVFLSGHSMGGDAAWDIGVAHPDLWAGIIPIVAVGDYGPNAPKYIAQYWPNVEYAPLYFVMGELDGKKLEMNRREFDRYLTKPRMDVMITEFIGRGHEHFYDEIHRLFAWMKLHRRSFERQEYSCVSMRSVDSFFFHLELSELPLTSVVNPYDWPNPKAKPSEHQFRKGANGMLLVKTGAAQAKLWFTPETADLRDRVMINVNGQPRAYEVLPDNQTILEDVRTRCDREHPFWAELELPTRKRR